MRAASSGNGWKQRRVDPMRDHIDHREFALATFLPQPCKGAFELLTGEVCVNHHTIRLFERRRILFLR